MLLLFKSVNVLEFENSDGSKVLALLGVLFTAMVSAVGLYIKNSIDERNLQLKEQAEARLKLDTELSAVKLLTTNAGTEAPEDQKAGALFGLINMEQIGFALALLDTLWSENKIKTISALWIISKSVQSEEHAAFAVQILKSNSNKLVNGDNILFPLELFLNWPSPFLDIRHRSFICEAFIEAYLFLPYKDLLNTPTTLIMNLRVAYTNEKDNWLRNALAHVIKHLTNTLPNGFKILNEDGNSITKEEILGGLEIVDEKVVDRYYHLIPSVRAWTQR